MNVFLFMMFAVPFGTHGADLDLNFLPFPAVAQNHVMGFLSDRDVAHLAETAQENKSTLAQILAQRHEEFKKGPATKALLCGIIKGRKKQAIIHDLPLSFLRPLVQHIKEFIKDDMEEDEKDSILVDTMSVVQINPRMLFDFVSTSKLLTKDVALDASKSSIIYSVASVAKIRPEGFDDFRRMALRFTLGVTEERVHSNIIYAVSYAATSRYISLPAFLEHAERETLMITDPKLKAAKLLELAKAFSR